MVDGQADVIVVGAGMSGLCASVAALEQGARVITVEKGTRFGGSMRMSNGSIWTWNDTDKLQEYTPNANHLLQGIIADRLSEGHDWLERHGVVMEPLGPAANGIGRTADPIEMTTTLVDRVRELGGQLHLETPLDELIYEGGAIRGVRATGPDGQVVFEADAVILATGGFQGNSELVMRYITPNVANMYVRSNPWSTGDAFLAATQVGAAVSPGLNCFYGHTIAAPPAVFNVDELVAMSQYYGSYAIALNLDGSRFADESAGTGEEALNMEVSRQRDATAFYILDAEMMEWSPPTKAPNQRAIIERVRTHGGTVIESNTLEGLCRQMGEHGVHSHQALSTLQEYNAAILEERAEELFPERRNNVFPLVRPPFTAVAVHSAITFTHGGLEVDPEMRVLRRSRTISTLPHVVANATEMKFDVIPGLYAVGCDAGNLSHGGYMGGLAPAMVTGRIAGYSAAETALSARASGTQV